MVGDGPPDRPAVVELKEDVVMVEVVVEVVVLLLKVVKDVMKVDSVGEETDKIKVESENTLDAEAVISTACELTMCVESRRIVYSENDSNCEQTYSMVESVKTNRSNLRR